MLAGFGGTTAKQLGKDEATVEILGGLYDAFLRAPSLH